MYHHYILIKNSKQHPWAVRREQQDSAIQQEKFETNPSPLCCAILSGCCLIIQHIHLNALSLVVFYDIYVP